MDGRTDGWTDGQTWGEEERLMTSHREQVSK